MSQNDLVLSHSAMAPARWRPPPLSSPRGGMPLSNHLLFPRLTPILLPSISFPPPRLPRIARPPPPIARRFLSLPVRRPVFTPRLTLPPQLPVHPPLPPFSSPPQFGPSFTRHLPRTGPTITRLNLIVRFLVPRFFHPIMPASTIFSNHPIGERLARRRYRRCRPRR